ncbi:MAG: cell wall-binding repeat-containing protein [Acidimicrobiales bacterium]
MAAGATATLTVTSIRYNTVGAIGTVAVTPTWKTSASTVTLGTFTPASAVNAVATHTTPAAPGVTALVAKSTPYVGRGSTGAAAGNWTATETASATPTTAKSEGWTKTTTITITVAPHTLPNCTTATNYVLVTGTPTATVGTTKTVSATPTVSVSTAAALPCTVNDHNVVSVTFTNSGTFTGATGKFSIMLSGVKYDVGKTTTTGTVKVGAKFTTTGTTFQATSTTGATATTPTHSGPSNADVTKLYVSANTPAVTLAANAFDASISPINAIEALPAEIPVSYVCVSLTATNAFNTSATATAKVTKGTGTVTSKVSYETSTGVKATTTANAGSGGYARFKVTKESVTTATTYTLSGLKVNASNAIGTTVTATVKYVSTATTCAVTGSPIGSATAYSIKKAAPVQIYGQTADATAAKLLQSRFSTATGLAANCIAGTNGTTSAANRPVILATTEHYQDALSSQYLASYLKTGTLLTPTAKLSAVTLQALKFEGVTQVDVVGGPLVVSTTVIAQLETTPAYSCGGGSKLLTSTGATRFLSVTRIYGQTAVETARDVAESAPTSHVKSLSFTTAYLGVNATKGNGAFNDTAGSGSPVPLTAATSKTAILASTTEFQDAMAASALSYWQTGGQGVPILLTNPLALSSAAQAAIATLGIKQVILMGGQLAVTNSVVTSLESLGISVLRVAGHTYTDTATQLAKFEESKPGMGLDWDTTTFAVARGNGFTDALVGADVAGHMTAAAHPEPMLLTTSPTVVGKYLTAFLKAHGATGTPIDTIDGHTLTSFTVFGGPLAVSPAVVSQMETDIS